MRVLGIPVNSLMRKVKTINEAEKFYEGLVKKRESFNYWTDGMVVQVNNRDDFRALGVVGKAPRGAIAWKYPAEEATTRLLDVVWSVGRTGQITPVAVLEPVLVQGTTVEHASLHNQDEIERLGVKISDTVVIHKAGDIIPKVIRSFVGLRTGREKNIVPPKVCPGCGNTLVRSDGEVALVCKNRGCFARLRERFVFAAGKNGLDIEGMGEKTIDQLIDAGLLQNLASFFKLTKSDFLGLEGFAELSAEKLERAISRRREIALPIFLASLGIPHVGKETALRLANHFRTR